MLKKKEEETDIDTDIETDIDFDFAEGRFEHANHCAISNPMSR